MLELTAEEHGVLLKIKVVPGASRTRLLGHWDGRVKVAVAAPPEKGKANRALVAFLAGRLGLRKRDVRVVSGKTGPLKTVRLEGVDCDAVRAVFVADPS